VLSGGARAKCWAGWAKEGSPPCIATGATSSADAWIYDPGQRCGTVGLLDALAIESAEFVAEVDSRSTSCAGISSARALGRSGRGEACSAGVGGVSFKQL
jgi:hypothetical protein